MKRVLLVCTGNICRSPLAEVMLRRELGLRGADGVEVWSAGTGAWEGAPASEGAYLVALENDLDLSEHRAPLLTREVVQDADVILTMARHHRARVHELGGEGRVHVLGEFVGRTGPQAEVADPFGSDLEVYRDTYVELDELIEQATERIVAELNGESDGT